MTQPVYDLPIPPAIKAKITMFSDAAQNYAFIGAAEVDSRPGIEAAYETARYNLYATINSALSRAKKEQ